MNIVRIPHLLKQGLLLLTLVSSGLLLTACGGDGKKSTNTTSSSSSSTSSHVFTSTPVSQPGSGVWPNVKVSANGTKTLSFQWEFPTNTPNPNFTFYKLLKKIGDNGSFEQVGSNFTTTSISDPVSVHLVDWMNTAYIVQGCNDNGCTDSDPIEIDSAMRNAVTYFKANNAEKDDWFGWSVAISGDGNTMAVGAPNEVTDITGDNSNNPNPTSGAVYIFVKANGEWTQEAYLKASNAEQAAPNSDTNALPNARFGYQVALSADGNTLAVSAINEDSYQVHINCQPLYYTVTSSYSSNSSMSAGVYTQRQKNYTGAVYVFKREASTWSQQAYIKPPFVNVDLNTYKINTNMQFGKVITLSGDGKTLVVGDSNDSQIGGGVAKLGLSSSASSVDLCIPAPTSDSSSSVSSSSSSSISSSSSTSSTSNSSTSSSTPGGKQSGAIYVYHLGDNGWEEDSYVKALDGGPGDSFGESVSLSDDGTLIAVGASGEDSNSSAQDAQVTFNTNYVSYLNAGAVYTFQFANGSWSQQAKIKPDHNEWFQSFGESVALSGDGTTLAVGTPGDWSKSASATDYVLEADTTTSIPIPKGGSTYGSGATYIFARNGDSWSQQAYVKPKNPIAGNRFGTAVSLSRDGDVLAVGTWLDSSQASGINGDDLDGSSPQSGAAYSFIRTGVDWMQASYIKAPISHANDRFGHALALDASGENLAIGAYRESGAGKGVNSNQSSSSTSSGSNSSSSSSTANASGAVYLY